MGAPKEAYARMGKSADVPAGGGRTAAAHGAQRTARRARRRSHAQQTGGARTSARVVASAEARVATVIILSAHRHDGGAGCVAGRENKKCFPGGSRVRSTGWHG